MKASKARTALSRISLTASTVPANVQITPEIAKQECAKEPIHRPGAIQAHGALLVVDPGSDLIQGSAGTLLEFLPGGSMLFGKTLSDVLGQSLVDYLGEHHLENATEAIYVGSLDHPDPSIEALDVLAHQSGSFVILEFEPSLRDRESAARLFTRIREAADRMRCCPTAEELFHTAAEEVRSFTGFDRVMVYRFLDDESGRVVGEALNDVYETLMHHRFPGGDIPSQARALYKRNIIRVIPDVQYVPAPIIGPHPNIDLSDSSLRSVSPVHLEYLVNMHVRASMSISLLANGELWGLIACHAESPLLVPYEVREACKYIAAELSRQIDRIERQADAALQGTLTREIDGLVSKLSSTDDVESELKASLPLLRSLFASDAILVRLDELTLVDGDDLDCLDAGTIFRHLDDVFCPVTSSSVVLEDIGIPLSDARSPNASACAILDAGGGVGIILLRKRQQEIVKWAGNPDRPFEIDLSGKLGPRRSFEVWQRTQQGAAPPWQEAEREAVEKLALTIERRLRQERLAAVQAQLIHVSRTSAMGALASALAHELNQPLTAISNFSKGLSLLLERGADADLYRVRLHLEQISTAAVRAGQVVKQLRAMVTKQPVVAEAFNISQVLSEALSLTLPDARVRGITTQVLAEPELKARGSMVQIEQVLSNLIRNAAEALEGQPLRRLTLSAQELDESFVELSVADTGPGLHPDIAQNCFSTFNSSKRDGMGLGLSICRTIVERHRGRIWLDHSGPTGTEFRFTLPRAQ
jgi:light-regulated signal transduction histidine kinase (bacteriophytochrome)